MASQHEAKRRQRSRMACEPCRERKRKCGGGNPCDMCNDFGYECFYRQTPRKRKTNGGQSNASNHALHASSLEESSVLQSEDQPPHNDTGVFVRSQESNSGSAFVRSFAMAVDPDTVPPFQTLAWNLFLGERQTNLLLPLQSITNLLSSADMQALVKIYFAKVDPCYGFVDRISVDQAVRDRWSLSGEGTIFDAVLCGLGAIGCVFSNLKDLATESSLVTLNKQILDSALSEEPSFNTATAWVLRTAYLRLTAKPEEAWIASCTALHMIDATGLHCEPNPNTPFRRAGISISVEIRRRIFGVARHMHTWLSFDLARSRMTLQNASLLLPAARPGDYTTELLELLPYTESLDPGKALSGSDLETAFSEVLNRTHSEPPSILAQCNLMLCLYRRLYTLRWKIPNETVEKAVSLIQRGIRAVHMNMENGSPWHHLGEYSVHKPFVRRRGDNECTFGDACVYSTYCRVANVPFQSICTLLAIDTVQSFSMLAEATSCLDLVDHTYRTRATKDAVAAARALIFMHQKRREADVKRQSEMLKCYPATQPTYDETFNDFPLSQAFTDVPWFNELIPDMELGSLDQFFTL